MAESVKTIYLHKLFSEVFEVVRFSPEIATLLNQAMSSPNSVSCLLTIRDQ